MSARIAVLALLALVLAAAAPVEGAVWPGGASVTTVDNGLGTNVSGLAYEPKGDGTKNVLWAVRNNPSMLYKLVWNGTRWVTAPGAWLDGRSLDFPGAPGGNPDAEGVTLADDASAVYVSIERNDVAAGNQDDISRPSILRFDTSAAGATLVATREWALAPDLPELPDNAGLEAVQWVPDAALVAEGFYDENKSKAYDPADYQNHGHGLFFVGVEDTGDVIAYALRQDASTFTRIATITSGFTAVMGLEWEPVANRLWVVCDNTCSGQAKTFEVGTNGRFAATATYDRPAGMANLNNEGFAITGLDECVGGLRPFYYADDGATGGNALRAGTIACPGAPTGNGNGGGGQQQQAQPQAPAPPASTALVPPAPVLPPPPPTDRVKPRVSGVRASRTSVTFTLSEPAKVAITVEKRSGRTFKKLGTVRLGGKRGTQTVKLSRTLKAKLRRGRVRFAVGATDAAGNTAVVARRTIG